ncbi:energy transducer TonB [Chitinimonas naiadis]
MTSLAYAHQAFAHSARRSPIRRQMREQTPPVTELTPAQLAASHAAVSKPKLGGWWWVLLAVAVHGGVAWLALQGKEAPVAASEPRQLKLTLTRPEPVKPPEPEPIRQAKPLPMAAKPKTVAPAPQPVATTPVALPQTEPAPSSAPAVPVAAAPVAPPVVEKVSEARGGIGYLNNPAPEYPRQAVAQGWEGRVLLLVKVAPDGTALQVDIKQSSGRKVLDDAAVRTVKAWRFAAAKRGDTAIEGWASVPIDFKL